MFLSKKKGGFGLILELGELPDELISWFNQVLTLPMKNLQMWS